MTRRPGLISSACTGGRIAPRTRPSPGPGGVVRVDRGDRRRSARAGIARAAHGDAAASVEAAADQGAILRRSQCRPPRRRASRRPARTRPAAGRGGGRQPRQHAQPARQAGRHGQRNALSAKRQGAQWHSRVAERLRSSSCEPVSHRNDSAIAPSAIAPAAAVATTFDRLLAASELASADGRVVLHRTDIDTALREMSLDRSLSSAALRPSTPAGAALRARFGGRH